jgi:predicted dehydrogenase
LAFTVSEVGLVAVADADPKRSEEVALRFGAKYHYTDYCQLLEHDDIDAVVIATPTSTHAQVIRDASTAGKHIFSEKPLGQTLEMCAQKSLALKAHFNRPLHWS